MRLGQLRKMRGVAIRLNWVLFLCVCVKAKQAHEELAEAVDNTHDAVKDLKGTIEKCSVSFGGSQ